MRDTIFISHATPDDNDFTIWLAARLTALGFKTWVDKSALIGGEKFWEEIDAVIRHEACKVVLVYSKNICINRCAGRLKDGISKELTLAESVAKGEKLRDFTLLLNLDNSPFNLFIGTDRFNQIPFADDWAEGLRRLVEKFDKDGVQRVNTGTREFTEWFQTAYQGSGAIVPKKELYYTNLWSIPSLPDKFYVYRYGSEKEARSVYLQEHPYPVSKASNLLASFAPPDALQSVSEQEGRSGPSIFKIDTAVAISGEDSVGSLSGRDTRNQLVFLLSRVFHEMMKRRGLCWYEHANKKQAYFFTPASLKNQKVSFQYPHRKANMRKTKALMGRYKNLGYWHYAISSRPQLDPEPAFLLKSHLVFTSDLHQVWDDKGKMHTHRRSKGKRWFNAEWRDLFLAFLQGLKDDQGMIEITLNADRALSMSSLPLMVWSDFGYIEPRTGDRLDVLADERIDDLLAGEDDGND